MVSLSRKFTVLATTAMAFAGAAYGQLTCSQTAAPNIVRAESTTELIAPITVICTAGAAGTPATGTGTINMTLSPTIPITSKVLDATTGKTEIVAVVQGANPLVQTFASVSGSNLNFSNLSFPQLGSGQSFTVIVSNIRINASMLALATGSAPVVSVNGYVANLTGGTFVVTAFTAPVQVAYIQTSLATPAIYGSYVTGNAGLSNGVASGTAGKFTTYATCAATSPKIDGLNLNTAVTPTKSFAFAVRLAENFVTAFKTAAEEGSSTAVTSGSATNAVANGTRFSVTFTAPTGVSLYVPTTVLTSTTSGATLQLTGSAAGTAHVPVNPTVDSNLAVTGTAFPLALVSGTATFEVLTSTTSTDTFDIPVFVVYSANAVATGGVISAVAGYSPSGSSVIPNFVAPTTTLSGSTFSACTTSLLFPFVSNQVGFDTGLAIANTSKDPFGTSGQSGTCQLSFYGSGAPATAVPATISLNGGDVYTELLSNLAPGFQGYIIAKCNFNLAHGYGYISYALGGPNGVAQGFLANVLPSSAARSGSSLESLGN